MVLPFESKIRVLDPVFALLEYVLSVLRLAVLTEERPDERPDNPEVPLADDLPEAVVL